MISFQAKYIAPATIKCKTSNNEYQNMDTSLVKLDLSSRSDKIALKKISKSWTKEFDRLEKQGNEMSGGTCFAKTIYDYYKTSRKTSDCMNYYAITTQADSFEKLNPDEVLGLARISNSEFGVYELEHLQARPQYTAFIENSKYKKIGHGILDSILETLPFREFRVISTIESYDFYDKYGLKYDPYTLGVSIIKENHK